VAHKILGVTSTKVPGRDSKQAVFASRLQIRKLLTEHLTVHYSKQFVRYKEDRDGVTVYFKDGTSARGDILVGADGANSPVRAQLIDGFKPDRSPYITALGSTTLTKEQHAPLLEHSSIGALFAAPGQKGYCLLMGYLEDDKAEFNYAIAWKAEDDELARLIPEGPRALLEKVKQRVEPWPPMLVEAVAQSQVSDIHWPPFRYIETLLPPHGLPRGRVTLLGDAAHSMVLEKSKPESFLETST
jgi:2-polyprenyl-6-methoxyphenol hydroxylase-like FAD-dependent oxidoreductase